MNLVILTGNLGRDPEIRYTQNGTAVANVNLATTEKYKGETKTEWHRLVAFGKTAELMGQYLSKGSKVGVQGKIQTRSWEQDGVTKYTTEIVVDRMEFLDSKPANQSSGTGQQQSAPAAGGQYDDFPVGDDDIPF